MVLKTQPPKALSGNTEADLGELRRVLMLLIAELNFVLREFDKGGDSVE